MLFKFKRVVLLVLVSVLVVAAFSIPPAPVTAVVRSGSSLIPTSGIICDTCPGGRWVGVIGSCYSKKNVQVGSVCQVTIKKCVREELDYSGSGVYCSSCQNIVYSLNLLNGGCSDYPEDDSTWGVQGFCGTCGNTPSPTPVPVVQTGGFFIRYQAPGAWFEVGSKDRADIWLCVWADQTGTVNVDFLPIGSFVYIWRIPDGAGAGVEIRPGRHEIFLSK